MQLFDPQPRTWLFAFTHPDDEISICAWMRRLVAAGADVWAGWSVTNPTREAEARASMAGIGVRGEQLFFGGFPDKGACDNLRGLTEFWRIAIDNAQPERIAAGAFECGHIDHDSTNFAVHKANVSRIPQLEIPFYHTYLTRVPVMNRFADEAGQEILNLDPAERQFKLGFSKNYPSQNIASLLVWYTFLGWAKGHPARLCRTERMRLQTHFGYTEPNLPSPLRERVMSSATWQRWLECVKRYDHE